MVILNSIKTGNLHVQTHLIPQMLKTVAIALCGASFVMNVPRVHAEGDVRQNILLDSGWQFTQCEVSGAENPVFDDSDWQTISVPHSWGWEQAQKGKDYYRGPSWYRRQLVVEPQRSRRYFLRFEAAGSVADVYFNGYLLGEHRGAFGAFCFEITTNLVSSGTNMLAVRVSNAPQDDIAPLTGDFPVFGGLYRPVHLIETSLDCFALTDHASPGVEWLQTSISPTQAVLNVIAQISSGTKEKQTMIFGTKLLDADGNEIAVTNQTIVPATNATAPYWAQLVVPNPRLWNGRKDPYLYKAVVEMKSTDGVVVDSVEQNLGLRFYHVDPEKGFFLNGEHYPVHGVSHHQDRPNKGWAISEADMEEDVALMKEMGVTAVRCSHYQQSDYFYSLCDKAGILVWAEIPQVDSINATAAFEETSRNQLLDLIRQNINHPAIFAWSLFNEVGNKPTDDPERELLDLANVAHGEDPTRPTIAATCTDKYPEMNKIPDVLGWNSYPGWYWGAATTEVVNEWLERKHYTSRQGGFCVSEYGAGANPAQHEDNPRQPKPTGQWHPEEWQAIVHEVDWEAIKTHPFVWGSFAWNMFDFTSYWRHEGGTVGLNDKGLVSYDRKIKKDAFYFYKANWADEPVVYITGRRFTERTNAVTNVKVYSNLPKATLLLNDKVIGTKAPNDECVIVWNGVKLAPGNNKVEVRAQDDKSRQESSDQCLWVLNQ